MTMEKQGSCYPFFQDDRNHYCYNFVNSSKAAINLTPQVVVNKLLVNDLYVKQKGIFFGLYNMHGEEILEPKYDNYFSIEDKGVLIFRMTNLKKKDSDLEHYSYGFLNIYTKEKTPCIYNKVVKLTLGLYDGLEGHVKHHLIKSDCKHDTN